MKDESSIDNPLAVKTYSFARRSIKLYRHLVTEQREFVLSKQILRCGTSIGANVAEANQAQSRPDFISKLSIALKEAVETEYWLRLLRDEQFIAPALAESLLAECRELIRMLTASIKTAKLRA
ncbi:MAG: four helix bundle protein [Pyrinomonadaceae bacterium]|nr:four helix bundle protein [Pyrinomonadaceae bacterium]